MSMTTTTPGTPDYFAKLFTEELGKLRRTTSEVRAYDIHLRVLDMLDMMRGTPEEREGVERLLAEAVAANRTHLVRLSDYSQ